VRRAPNPLEIDAVHVVALGLLDGPDLLRLPFAPDAQRDEALAEQLVADVTERRTRTAR
jgi:hypothetical protein